MEGLNVIEILKLGLPGLVFMLSILSFRLLGKEQGKPSPNVRILGSIRQFMYINVGLAVLTVAAPLVEKQLNRLGIEELTFSVKVRASNDGLKTGTASVCRDAEYAGRYLLISNLDEGLGALAQVEGKHGHPCNGEQVIFLSQKDSERLKLDFEGDTPLTLIVTAANPGYKFAIDSGVDL